MVGGAKSGQLKSADAVIVGGGVIGLSIARELARRGAGEVFLIDRGEFGGEASWAAGGILGPQVEADRADDFFRLACASRDMYPAFAAALTEETGVDIELDQTGTLDVAFSESDERKLRSIYNWQTSEGLNVEWLTGDEARGLEPSLSPRVHCALRFSDDWQIENRKLLRALVTANEQLGVRLLANCEARSIRIASGRLLGLETSIGFIEAECVVVAAGAWTSEISSSGATSIEIEPVRGQMLCFKPEVTMARHVLYSSRGYLVPRRDGRLVAGSTSEHVGFDKRVTDEGVQSIKSMAFEIVPRLTSETVVDVWAGFRPRAADDLPVLGPDAEVKGLLYATGHYRNGILLAPITAELLVESIIDGVTSSLLDGFSPRRFSMIDA